MGCISVNIGYELCKPSVSTSFENELSVSAGMINGGFRIDLDYACSKPSVSIGFICKTNLGDECILWSSDAVLMSVNDEYFIAKEK